MAAWQFDLHLVPRSTAAEFGFPPGYRLTLEQFDATDWWENHSIAGSYVSQLADVLPWRLPWSDDWQVFGTDDGDRIDMLTVMGRVEEIRARLDARALNAEFVERLIAFARNSDLLLIGPSLRVFEPSVESLWVEFQLSPAVDFARDPSQFLARLRRGQSNRS